MSNSGEFVRAARERAGFSARELAERAGCSLRYINDIQRGYVPSRRVLLDLSNALKLSWWEERFLFACCGRMLPESPIDSLHSVQSYLDALMQPSPAVMLSPSWKMTAWNKEWERLFTGVWMVKSMHQWLYTSTTSRRIIRNWDEASQWCVGWLRYGQAVDPDTVSPVVQALMPITEFRRQWESQVIPVDPATRPWIVRDTDHGCELTIDMRVWRATPIPGTLLLGAVRDAG